MMEKKLLNIVFIGQQTFPEGTATTKRRRYLIDYLNACHISNSVLVTYYHSTLYKNEPKGLYGNTPFVSIHNYAASGNFSGYYTEGKRCLRKWFHSDASNIIIFPTVLTVVDYPLYKYARKLGYKIVFDQVETSYLKSGKLKLSTKLYYWINEIFSKRAYRKAASFVISSGLLDYNKRKYPNMKLAILPNSTPILCTKEKSALNTTIEILYSGTYGEKEGVRYLINGVLKANKKGLECKLTLLGNAPSSLKTEYANYDIIEFKGFVSEAELKNALSRADVLAMVRTNSLFANFGFPFKLSEYLATGGIVMATNVGDVSKYLKDKENAYLIEPESEEAICETLIRIKDNPEEALKIARNGLKVMKDKFSINAVGKNFVSFLEDL